MILLVEDEPQVRAVTARILRTAGHVVLTAHDERSALAHASEHGPSIQLVVADLVLPGVSGEDLARRLQIFCPYAQTLYVSGYALEQGEESQSARFFLRKPYTAQELLSVVRELLPSATRAQDRPRSSPGQER